MIRIFMDVYSGFTNLTIPEKVAYDNNYDSRKKKIG